MRSRTLLLATAVLLANACRPTDQSIVQPEPDPTVAEVSITAAVQRLDAIGATVRLSAATLDASGSAVQATVTWSSGAVAVASVDETGLVTAVGEGEAEVTATAGAVSSSISIEVVPIPVRVELDPDSIVLSSVGAVADITAHTFDSGDTEVHASGGSWTSSRSDVAAVDDAGRVEAISVGTALITFTLDDLADTAVVVVEGPPVQPGPVDWSVEASAFLQQQAVWAMGPDDFVSVGLLASVLRNQGSGWVDISPEVDDDPRLSDVWASSPTDIWAVGQFGTILHFDGGSWTMDRSVTASWITSVWGTAADDVWIGTQTGDTFRFDGTAWTQWAAPTSGPIRGFWGTASDNVYAVGSGVVLHYDGSGWSLNLLPGRPEFEAIWGSAADDIWIVGEAAFRFDGTDWLAQSAPRLDDLWGAAGDDIWGVVEGAQFGPGAVHHYDGTSWSTATPPGVSIEQFWAVAGTSADNVITVGRTSGGASGNVSYRWNGTGWSDETPGVLAAPLVDVWGASDDDLWAVGDRRALAYFDGTTWSDVSFDLSPGQNFSAVWGTAANDVWAFGSAGYIAHFDGASWSNVSPVVSVTNRRTHYDAWGAAPDDVWAVGALGQILHWNGSSWSRWDAGIAADFLFGAWGSSANDVWAVGYSGNSPVIARWDGSTWNDVSPPISGRLRDVWGTGPNDVWAVGGSGAALLHYNGTSWSEMPAPLGEEELLQIVGTGASDVWVRTAGLGLLHWDGSTWSDGGTVPNPVDFTGHLRVSDDLAAPLWMVGHGGTIWRGERR